LPPENGLHGDLVRSEDEQSIDLRDERPTIIEIQLAHIKRTSKPRFPGAVPIIRRDHEV
jgi:hypothetical protein